MLREDVDGSAHQRPVTSYPVYVHGAVCLSMDFATLFLSPCMRASGIPARTADADREKRDQHFRACVCVVNGGSVCQCALCVIKFVNSSL